MISLMCGILKKRKQQQQQQQNGQTHRNREQKSSCQGVGETGRGW